jgi:hypothetical protein
MSAENKVEFYSKIFERAPPRSARRMRALPANSIFFIFIAVFIFQRPLKRNELFSVEQ